MMNKQWHHIIQFACITALLATIVLQGFTHVVKLKPLSPYTSNIVVEKQDLTFKTYLDGSYQEYLGNLARQKTGFREFFSRCHNQVAYSCFGKIANKNIYKGKHHELYLKASLDDITGKLLRSKYGTIENAKADAQKNVQETLTLIDTLRQHGTQFLFVFCPTKPAVYPETIPDVFKDSISDFSLADYYIELFKENDIPHIDFYNYFKTIKDTFPYPLYTRFGSHWSEATIPFVADSILRKLEAETGYRFPAIELIDPNLTRDYSDQDAELEAGIDLLLPLCKPKVSRPVFTLKDTIDKDWPNLLVVGDGYFTQLQGSCFVEAFNQWDYWRYNQTSISSRPELNWNYLNQMFNTAETLEQADVVLAVFASNYLLNYLCGFNQSALELYENGITKEQESILPIMESIKNDPQWYGSIQQQAQERGISIEECLIKNAAYVYEMQKIEQEKSNKQP
jgi:hypothetical protein